MSLIVKVCGLRRAEEVRAAAEAGADWFGLVFWPRSPRFVREGEAAALRREAGDRLLPVGVFVDAPLAQVVECSLRVGLGAIQLHGAEPLAYAEAVRRATGLPLIRAWRLPPEGPLAPPPAPAGVTWLLEPRVPGRAGGSGARLDWRDLGGRSAELPRPFLLAGGLCAENVAEALTALHPDGVDVSSGVEGPEHHKDPEKIAAFIAAVRRWETDAAS